MDSMKRTIWTVLITLCFTYSLSVGDATYQFVVISDNSALSPDIAKQLFVEIEDLGLNTKGSNQVSFTFRNLKIENWLNSTISEIYFEDGATLQSLEIIENGPGVAFSGNEFKEVSPGNLPEGNNLNPSFVATASLSSDADPGNVNGVDPGEYVKLTFSLFDNIDYLSVFDGLDSDLTYNDNIRIGLHVTGLPDGESDSFINTTIAPAPGAILLGGIGITCAGWLKRRRRL